MEPYFPTMTAILPLCRKRAALKTWSRGGHAAFGTWGQQSEMMGCGVTSFSVMGGCPDDVGGYDGFECPSAMGAFPEMTTGHDSSTRFVAALMSTPYIEYYEHSLNNSFLNSQAFPMVAGAADFYASYARADNITGVYNLLWTCAQEICQQRQNNFFVNQRNSNIDIAHAKMALEKAAEWALSGLVTGSTATLSARATRWLRVSRGLAPLPVTTDSAKLAHGPNGIPLVGMRRVWSESMMEVPSERNSSVWGGSCQGFADYFDSHAGLDWGCASFEETRWWVHKPCQMLQTNESALHGGCPGGSTATAPAINCTGVHKMGPCAPNRSVACLDASVDKGWNIGVCQCRSGWSGRLCDIPASITVEAAPFGTNYMYPIIHFSPVHPTNLMGLYTDAWSGNDTAAHNALLEVGSATVWGDNERSAWRPVNGLCLAWPTATRLTDGKRAGRANALLDRYESALNATMQPNFWPSMSGGGLEQVGATVAVNELLLQSHEGFLAFFPAWGDGAGTGPASFTTLRARGAFLVSANTSSSTGVTGIVIFSEVGARCKFLPPWEDITPVVRCDGNHVQVNATSVKGVRVWEFDTTKGATYTLAPA
jgi:hypothetical protein